MTMRCVATLSAPIVVHVTLVLSEMEEIVSVCILGAVNLVRLATRKNNKILQILVAALI